MCNKPLVVTHGTSFISVLKISFDPEGRALPLDSNQFDPIDPSGLKWYIGGSWTIQLLSYKSEFIIDLFSDKETSDKVKKGC